MSKIIDKNIASAKSLDLEIRKKMLGDNGELTNANFTPIDVAYPDTIEDNKAIPDKATVAKRHQEWVDSIAKLQLTNSLFLGLGFEPPESHALSFETTQRMVEEAGASITVNKDVYKEDEISFHSFKIVLPAAEYKFLESDLWLGNLRALHFLAVRHDPDLTEAINRQLSDFSGLNNSAWLDAAGKPKAE